MHNQSIALLAGLVAMLVWANGAAGAGQDTNPQWVKRPTPEDLFTVFPAKAVEQGVDGKTVIQCEVAIDGAARACRVVSETPPGMGFGAAAIALAPQFRFRPALRDGKPVVAEVLVPITFDAPAGNSPNRNLSPPIADGPRTFTRMGWDRAPTRAEVAAAYPAGGTAAGYAIMDCTLKEDGRLSGCEVRQENPRGKRFGPAVRSLADRFQARVTSGGTLPIKGAHVLVTVRFDPPGAADVGISSQLEWAAQPGPADLVYPATARAAGVRDGKGVIDCVVLPSGLLGDCRLVEETPAGAGFGVAAMALAPKFRVNPWTDGRPTEGRRIKLPMRFVDDQPAAPATGG